MVISRELQSLVANLLKLFRPVITHFHLMQHTGLAHVHTLVCVLLFQSILSWLSIAQRLIVVLLSHVELVSIAF